MILLCIDKYENKNPVGRVYSPAADTSVEFASTVEMLLYVSSLLERTKAPQSFSTIRAFRPAEESDEPSPSADMSRSGEVATFALKILFRQNSSWQGSVTWCEGNQEESFRSVLELLLLMDSAMSADE